MKLFKQSALAAALAATLCGTVQAVSTPSFTPGHLVVLRVGNPGLTGTNEILTDFNSGKENPVFIDDFDPSLANATVAAYSVALPTNGDNSIWINGGGGTEGGMTRSADRSILTLTGYHGDVGSLGFAGAPSALPFKRAIGTVDAFGTNSLALISDNWYGVTTGKTNPRDVATDGTNSFWGAGNPTSGTGIAGTLLYSPTINDGYPTSLQSQTATRAVKIINNTLYTSVTGGKVTENGGLPPGIYNFLDYGNQPVGLPTGFVQFHQVVPCDTQYTNISGFYLNPQQTICYVADVAWGVQKYVKSAGQWKFACNYSVGGYEISKTGTLTVVNDVKNGFGGAFDVVADFSGTNPVIYATTEDISYANQKNANTNRIVRIVDTNTAITRLTYTNFTVVAQTTSTNVGFRAIDFAPDLRPIITVPPADLSVVTNTTASFSVGVASSAAADSYSTISYQWLQNSNAIAGQTNSTLTFTPDMSYNGNVYQCVVSNAFGAVTSAPPANLTVTLAPVAPYNLGMLQHLTNAIGDNASITATAGGTSPLSYQWYVGNPAAGGTALTDANEFTGTTNSTLNVGNAQIGVDDTNYYCVVSNSAGASNIYAATLTLVYPVPSFAAQPSSITVFSNTPATFTAQGYGSSLAYHWYSNNVAVADGTSSTLTINPATVNGNYTVVVTNFGGAVTSVVATLTVVIAPPHTFVNYTNAGQVYFQNFDSLPVVTNATVNTANPVSFWQVGSVNQVIYSIDNPFDFAYPVMASGSLGGLGLTNTMAGWYGWGQLGSKLGGHQGDQSTGGMIDYGTLSADGSTGETNRALGMQSTSTTGDCAIGVKLVNHGTNALAYVTVQFIGELWRNQPNANSLEFGYYIDTDTNAAFAPANALASLVPNLFVSFTPSGTLTTVDGSLAGNQINLAVTNLNIGSWPTNTALWLVWQQTNSVGSAQGLAIDNVSFSASATLPATVITPLNINTGSTHLTGSGSSRTVSFSFTNATGLSFSVLGTNNLTAPKTNWPVVGAAIESPAGSGNYQFTNSSAAGAQQYYIIRQP
jgi:hypothetical protein